MRSVELFAGAGGLALGVSQAGFLHEAVVELDHDACDTIRTNKERKVEHVAEWRLHEANVKSFDFASVPDDIDLLAAGVPCQPWSIGGKHRGYEDERNLFPDTIRAVVALRPKAILIENVKGLTRPTFANYFTYIQFMLEFPELRRLPDEEWTDHRKRLEELVSSSGKGYGGLRYRVVPKLVNAADYGVPQRRERVFIVAFRTDLGIEWSFPDETHSQDALLVSQWLTGEYWERHKVPQKHRPPKPPWVESRIAEAPLFSRRAWLTVRDRIADLPDPGSSLACSVPNHGLQAGARIYAGHTGSPLDEPAKTLKAGDHGVPGGENMIAFPDGGVRYFSVREAARIQTFPDNFVFASSWTENMRQLGNAVPVELGRVIADDIKRALVFSRCLNENKSNERRATVQSTGQAKSRN
ncbi:MAG: DNA cytosine methyltransferase [Bryobacterales bacterium]|nr:DNA cytosine methyltransferase [Bryobacterales bacterium]